MLPGWMKCVGFVWVSVRYNGGPLSRIPQVWRFVCASPVLWFWTRQPKSQGLSDMQNDRILAWSHEVSCVQETKGPTQLSQKSGQSTLQCILPQAAYSPKHRLIWTCHLVMVRYIYRKIKIWTCHLELVRHVCFALIAQGQGSFVVVVTNSGCSIYYIYMLQKSRFWKIQNRLCVAETAKSKISHLKELRLKGNQAQYSSKNNIITGWSTQGTRSACSANLTITLHFPDGFCQCLAASNMQPMRVQWELVRNGTRDVFKEGVREGMTLALTALSLQAAWYISPKSLLLHKAFPAGWDTRHETGHTCCGFRSVWFTGSVSDLYGEGQVVWMCVKLLRSQVVMSVGCFTHSEHQQEGHHGW